MAATATDGSATQSGATDASLAADLERFADQLVRTDQFAGVVLLKRHGRVIFQRAYGVADRDANRVNTTETPFALGSVSKMFTAVLVAQLVEQNKIRLDSTIGSLLPNFPVGRGEIAGHCPSTADDVLGIPDVFRLPQFWATLSRARTLSDFWPVFATAPLEFTPGDR
jgi:hypothetical protein